MPETLKRLLGRNAWRAIGAWLVTCYLVAVVVLFGFTFASALEAAADPSRSPNWSTVTMSPWWALFAGAVLAALSSLPVWGLVSLFRGARWPRPLSEVIAGGVIGLAMMELLLGFSARGPGGQGWLPFWLYPTFLTLGAAAGWTYWRLAGRPGRPADPVGEALKARVFD